MVSVATETDPAPFFLKKTGSPNSTFCAPGQTNFTGYRNHFRMPSDVSGGLENFWYSYDYGMGKKPSSDSHHDSENFADNDLNKCTM